MTAGPACTKPVSKTQRLAKELNILRASEQPTNDGLLTETEQKEPTVDKSAVPTDATEAAVVPVTAPQESPIAAVTVTTVESPSAAASGSPEVSSVASTTPPPVNASVDSPVQSSAAADAHSPPSPAVASLTDAHVVQPIQQPSVSLPSSPIDSVFASSAKSNVAADARSPVDSAVASPKAPHISSVATSTADSPAALPSRPTAVTYTPLSDFHSAPTSLPDVASVHEPVPPAAAAFILSAHLNNEPEQEPPKEHGKQDRKRLKRQREHTSDDGASFSDPQILPGVESPSQPVYQYPLQHRLFQSSAPADPEVMPPSPLGKLPSMLTTFSSSTAASLGAVNPTINAPIIIEQSKSPDATADVPMGNDQEVVGSSQRTGEAENDMELDKLELLQVINLVQSPNAWSHTQQVADEDVKMDGVDIQAVHTHDQIMTGTGTQSTEQDIQVGMDLDSAPRLEHRALSPTPENMDWSLPSTPKEFAPPPQQPGLSSPGSISSSSLQLSPTSLMGSPGHALSPLRHDETTGASQNSHRSPLPVELPSPVSLSSQFSSAAPLPLPLPSISQREEGKEINTTLDDTAAAADDSPAASSDLAAAASIRASEPDSTPASVPITSPKMAVTSLPKNVAMNHSAVPDNVTASGSEVLAVQTAALVPQPQTSHSKPTKETSLPKSQHTPAQPIRRPARSANPFMAPRRRPTNKQPNCAALPAARSGVTCALLGPDGRPIPQSTTPAPAPASQSVLDGVRVFNIRDGPPPLAKRTILRPDKPAVQRRYSETLFYEEPVQVEPMVIDRRIAPLPLRAQRRQAAKSAVDDESRRKSARVARETRHQLHADEDKSSTDDSEEGRVSRRPRFMAGDNGQTTDIPSLKDIREQDRRTVAHQVQWNHTHESVAMLFDIFDREGYSPNWDDERERRHLGEHCWKQLLQRNRPAPGAVIDRNTFARWYAEWMREIVTFVSLPGSQRIIERGDVTKIFNMWMAAQSERDKVTLEKTFAE
ncbi:hypothetical protein CTRI78_v010390 [Colletotrichum trifolii]|uniref:Uncharacterized protein n=1 Tax=Colletotrichum trifolii TaxID=5466 RepID=A0A4R8QM36_COLTR|nr:hypothetical protein CTRI78_v010390 [Colletotrichum trifolii]